ncbi:hypothetical protein KJ652_03885 [Patescibacteria group bacterium]|nr:hypothetical protein [Patescibacteria group bacterium]MBU1123706.1 hypothetical protein [Patescibacteria group bacterium]
MPLLDLLFPQRSLSGKSGEWITELERSELSSYPITENTEQLRSRGLKNIDAIYAGSDYQGCPYLHKAIHTFKYNRIKPLADDLAKLMLFNTPPLSDSVLCPVPLHWSRKFSRGFNQAELLATIVSRETNIPITNILYRTRPTGYQMKRNRAQRLVALKDAFVSTSKNPPPRVILIDDLSTTGATLDECAGALKRAGVKFVAGWVVAHG